MYEIEVWGCAPDYLISKIQTSQLKTNEKYLGQILETNNATSALATVKHRAGRIKGATMEIKSIVEEYMRKI